MPLGIAGATGENVRPDTHNGRRGQCGNEERGDDQSAWSADAAGNGSSGKGGGRWHLGQSIMQMRNIIESCARTAAALPLAGSGRQAGSTGAPYRNRNDAAA